MFCNILILLLDETPLPVPNTHLVGNKISTSCGNEGLGGNAMLVNVQNSNETVKNSSQESSAPPSYQARVSNAPTFPLPLNSEILGMNNHFKSQQPTTASSESSSSNYNTKCNLPQDALQGESNKNIKTVGSENSKATYESNVTEKLTLTSKKGDVNMLSVETKTNSELNDKCDPRDRVGGCNPVRTDISDKSDNQSTYETAKSAGATEDSVSKMLNSSHVSAVINKFESQSQNISSKSEAYKNSISSSNVGKSLQSKEDLCVRKNIDSTTTNSCFPPQNLLKSTTILDNKNGVFDTLKTSSANLAALEKAISEKKVTAMLPIQKLSSTPAKATPSFFGGGGGKLGGALDGLLRQAEARAAKEASVAAAAANAKKNNLKEDVPKDITMPPYTKENRTDTNIKKDFSPDDEKGRQ